MKRILIATLAAAILTANASAYRVPHQDEGGNIIRLEDANCDPQAQAEMLQKLGLFMGTDNGFGLDRAMTRAEAAAMLCRFLGGTAEAETGSWEHPFRDVPAWADHAVGWLYQNKLTYGISEKEYGANQPVTAGQYAIFLSRAVYGNDDGDHWFLGTAESAALDGQPFLRSYAVGMSVRALMHSPGSSPETLAQRLAEKGVYTAAQFADAAWDVIVPWYDEHLSSAAIAGVTYAESKTQGLRPYWEANSSTLPYFYATRDEAGESVLYRLDWRTLAEELVGRFPVVGEYQWVHLLGELDGKDYLLVVSEGAKTGRLYSVKGTELTLELSENDIGGVVPEKQEAAEGTLVFTTAQGKAVVDRTGVRLTEAADEVAVLYTGDGYEVRQSVNHSETTISSMNSATKEIISTYTVPQDMAGEPHTVAYDEGDFIGEAGFYTTRYSEKPGELKQLLDTAVIERAVSPDGSQILCLSHQPGTRVPGHIGYGGDTVLLLNPHTGESETLIDASAGLEIAGFYAGGAQTLTSLSEGDGHSDVIEGSVFDGKRVQFFTSRPEGMMHYSICIYSLDCESKKITVLDYTAGRPELAEGFDYGNPEGYKKQYIEKEQARLDAVWNSKQ